MGRNRTQPAIGIEYLEFGERLKALRIGRGMTQAELSKEMGISKTSVVNYETGTRKIPLELIIAFAEYFGVSVDSLIGIRFSGYSDDRPTILSSNPHIIATAARWYNEVGNPEFTDEEMDELISFAKYLKSKRGEKNG